jgi:chemotaxis protein MotA
MSGLLGLFAGLMVIVGGALSDEDPLGSLVSLTATIIVIGGTFAALFTQFGLGPIMIGFKGFGWMIKPKKTDLHAFIEQMAEWSNLSRSQGTLALESVLGDVKDPFQKKGLQMIIDNTSPEDMHSILNILADHQAREEKEAGEIWEAAGGYSPTIGVMGAVLGLIHVMMRLNHPEELGAGIATAFVATIYGVGAANLVFLPIGNRFKGMAQAQARTRSIVIQGFVLLAEGKPGIMIRQNLQSFIHEKHKPKKAGASAEGGVGAEAAA